MQKLYETAGIAATIDPASYTTGTQDSDEVDMTKFHDLMAIVQLGALQSGAIVEGTVLSGAVTGTLSTTVKAMTRLTKTGSDDNKQAIIYVRGDQMTATHRYAKLQVAVTGTAIVGATVLGVRPRYGPATDNDLSSVAGVYVP